MVGFGQRETADLVADFECLAQELTRRMAQSDEPLKAKFPRGHIRRIWALRDRWPYLPQNEARTVACAVQLSDVNRWMLNIWKIEWTAGDLCEWQATVPLVAIIELLLVEYAVVQGWASRRPTFKEAIQLHTRNGILDDVLATELEDLRDCRNEIHLYLKDRVAIHDGNPSRYNRAVLALQSLEGRLKEHWLQNPCR